MLLKRIDKGLPGGRLAVLHSLYHQFGHSQPGPGFSTTLRRGRNPATEDGTARATQPDAGFLLAVAAKRDSTACTILELEFPAIKKQLVITFDAELLERVGLGSRLAATFAGQ
jgi:hypothetical protein